MSIDSIIMGSDSDSDDSDDFDVLSLLTNNKNAITGKLVRKRPNLFEQDDSTGFKKLKVAPSIAPPPFFRDSGIDILKKSDELAALHKRDEEEALSVLAKEEDMKRKIQESLSKGALKDQSYVNYITENYESARIRDFIYLTVPKYVKAVETDPIEFLTIEDKSRSLNGDIFNLLDEGFIKNIHFNIKINMKKVSKGEEIDQFFKNIGVKDVSLEKIEELIIDPRNNLQPISLILIKLDKFIEYLITTTFNQKKFNKLIKHLGFLMMDINVFKSGNNNVLTKIINKLIKWSFKSSIKSFQFDKIIEIWNKLSDKNIFLIRIIETLDPLISLIIEQLRLQFTLSILNISPFKFRYFKHKNELQNLIDKTLIKELKQLLAIDYTDDSCDFLSLRIKFQSTIILLNLRNESTKTLEDIKHIITDIQNKVPQKLGNNDLSIMRSVIIMLFNIL